MTRTRCYDVIPTVRNCLTCGRNHTPDDWRALDIIELQELPGDDGETPMLLEWRRCICGNALSIDLADPQWEAFSGQGHSADGALAAAAAAAREERVAAEQLTIELAGLLSRPDCGRAMVAALANYGRRVQARRGAVRRALESLDLEVHHG